MIKGISYEGGIPQILSPIFLSLHEDPPIIIIEESTPLTLTLSNSLNRFQCTSTRPVVTEVLRIGGKRTTEGPPSTNPTLETKKDGIASTSRITDLGIFCTPRWDGGHEVAESLTMEKGFPRIRTTPWVLEEKVTEVPHSRGPPFNVLVLPNKDKPPDKTPWTF